MSDFPGIYDALRMSGTKSVDMILVHGMCTHTDDWVRQINEVLAESLNVKVEAIDPAILLGDASYPGQSSHDAELYIGRISGFGFTVNTFSILWSPISDDAKGALCYDVSGGNATCSSAGMVTTGKRVWANRSLKETLLDNCLADAVFYSGEVGKQKIQAEIRRGVSLALFGNRNDLCGEHVTVGLEMTSSKGATPLIFLTESLGSKMLYDTLINTANSCGNAHLHGFANALQRPIEVFMAANQMPILSLADSAPDPSVNLGTPPAAARLPAARDVTPAVNPVIDILRLSSRRGVPTATLRQPNEGQANEVGVLAPQWVVAFSDPNDLFSYTLRSSDCEDGKTCGTVDSIHFSDVLVSNDWSYLFSLENPYSAHTEYLDRKASGIGQVVAKMIACGGRNYKQPCDPSTDGAGMAARP